MSLTTNRGSQVLAHVTLLPLIWQWRMFVQVLTVTKLSFRQTFGAVAFVPGFPYNILYRQAGSDIEVLVVAPHRRRPDYWLDRV
jgi:hypothetical protein